MSRYLLQRALCHAALPISKKRSAPVELSDAQEEFYEHLGEMSSTQVEPGINQDEVFDDQFERRAHELQRTPPSTGAVTVIPAKTGPWTGNNNLGIERPFAPDTNNRQTILKLPEWGFPEVWTLALGLVYDTNLYDPNGSFFSVTAEIEFGCGGCIQIVEMDWLQGSAISLPMNALNVVASFDSSLNEGGVPIELPSDLRLRATLVRNGFSNVNPTRSYLAEGVDPVVPVPPFAKSVRITPRITQPFTFYTDTSTVRFMSGNPNSFAIATIATHQRSQFVEYINVLDELVGMPRYVDVPEGARFLQIREPAGLSATNVQFKLGV